MRLAMPRGSKSRAFRWIALLGALAAHSFAPAQPVAEADIRALIRSSQLPMAPTTEGSFRGEGWDHLVADGGRAQFFVVGEQHFIHEIITLESALHRQLAGLGYSHAAMEIGPYSAAKVERLIRSGPRALTDFMNETGHRGIFPFLPLREDAELAEQYVALSAGHEALWGLDQEYLGAAAILAEFLSARARTATQRSAVSQLARAAAADPNYLIDLVPGNLAPLERAFGNDIIARQAIEDFRLSNAIYAPFRIPGSNRYWANFTRENYMKRNFATAFARAERRSRVAPRVFLAMGGNHARRGFSPTNVPSLTNFLAEWGVPRGFATVNVMIDCYDSAPGSSCEPYFGTDNAVYAAAAASGDTYTLFDLRPIRARLHDFAQVDATTRDLVEGFDFYILIRRVTRATRSNQGVTGIASPTGTPPSR